MSPTEEEYLYCIRCGLCLSACPIYREHLIETQSPRGRVALIRKMVEGDLKPSPYLTDQMYQCMACLACNTACPSASSCRSGPANRALLGSIVRTGGKDLCFADSSCTCGHGDRDMATTPVSEAWVAESFQGLGLNKALPAQLRDMERMVRGCPAGH